jgi:hypothetical protein
VTRSVNRPLGTEKVSLRLCTQGQRDRELYVSPLYIDQNNEPLWLIVFNLVYQVTNTLYSFQKAPAFTVLVQYPIVLFTERPLVTVLARDPRPSYLSLSAKTNLSLLSQLLRS